MTLMDPAELAALVAREADAGAAAALAAVDASGAFVLEQVVARVRTVVHEESDPDREWEAELHLRHVASPTPGVAEGATPAVVAGLPVRAVRGVGARWEARLADLGIRTVGGLAASPPVAGVAGAVLLARARACAGGWPPVDRRDRRTVLAVALQGPAPDGAPVGSRESAAALWARCVALLGALDEQVCAGLAVADVAGPA